MPTKQHVCARTQRKTYIHLDSRHVIEYVIEHALVTTNHAIIDKLQHTAQLLLAVCGCILIWIQLGPLKIMRLCVRRVRVFICLFALYCLWCSILWVHEGWCVLARVTSCMAREWMNIRARKKTDALQQRRLSPTEYYFQRRCAWGNDCIVEHWLTNVETAGKLTIADLHACIFIHSSTTTTTTTTALLQTDWSTRVVR